MKVAERLAQIEQEKAEGRVFRPAAEPERVAEIAAIPDEAIDTSDIPEGTEAEFERATLTMPLPPREPIETAPRDGRIVTVFWDNEAFCDVRWKVSRRWNGRRWVPGGLWVRVDNGVPLPAAEPVVWLRPVDYDPPPPEGEDEAQAAA